MTGPTGVGESGRWYPTKKVEVWLDAAPRADARERLGGPDVLLGQRDIGIECEFSVGFEIPDVVPGSHDLNVIVYEEFLGGSGSRMSGPIELTVSG